MRYLIFGDVHGNLPALEKLLKVERGRYDQIISHGDVVNYGPWSNECVQLLSTIPDLISLKGNHEENYLQGNYSGTNKVAKTFFEFCYPRFSEFEAIGEYGEEKRLKDYAVRHTVEERYVYPDTDLAELNLNENYIIGHSHYQFNRVFEEKRIVNTGSLGQNRKLINNAEYIVYDDKKNSIELKSFVYDVDQVIKKMQTENYPQLCVDYYQNKRRLK